MILPTKHLQQERALLTVGATLLASLERPMTVSALWQRVDAGSPAAPSFDWFVLALDLLYALGAIELRDGLIIRGASAAEQST